MMDGNVGIVESDVDPVALGTVGWTGHRIESIEIVGIGIQSFEHWSDSVVGWNGETESRRHWNSNRQEHSTVVSSLVEALVSGSHE